MSSSGRQISDLPRPSDWPETPTTFRRRAPRDAGSLDLRKHRNWHSASDLSSGALRQDDGSQRALTCDARSDGTDAREVSALDRAVQGPRAGTVRGRTSVRRELVAWNARSGA